MPTMPGLPGMALPTSPPGTRLPPPGPVAPTSPARVTDPADIAKAWAAAAEVGAGHAALAKFAGVWDVEVRLLADEKTEPTITRARCTNTLVLGGRFLHLQFVGKLGADDYAGFGTWGFDNVAKRYQGHWVDSLATGMQLSTGVWDESARTLTFSSDSTVPMGEGATDVVRQREVETLDGPDKYHSEIFNTFPNATESKSIEMTFTRVGAKPEAPGISDAKKRVDEDVNIATEELRRKMREAMKGLDPAARKTPPLPSDVPPPPPANAPK